MQMRFSPLAKAGLLTLFPLDLMIKKLCLLLPDFTAYVKKKVLSINKKAERFDFSGKA